MKTCWLWIGLLTGCGGSPFVAGLGAPDPLGEDAPVAPMPPPDIAADAGATALGSGEGGAAGDALSAPDVSGPADGSKEAGRPPDDGRADAPMKEPDEAGLAEAAAESGACVPQGPGSVRCEGSVEVSTPETFCLGTYQGSTPVGNATPTPAACQCAGAFTCACVLAALPGLCPPPASAHCQDSGAGPAVTCL